MGTTPTYGLRYEDLGDPPDGAALGQHLAEDVEAQLTRMDTVSSMQVFTANGTYTKPPNLKAVRVRLVGGGGGGGVAFAAPAGQASCGGGGAGGGYSERIIPASLLAATTAITIGAGGLGANPPTAGGTTSFGSFCSGSGGTAGVSMTPAGNSVIDGGTGGSGTGGDLNIDGSDGSRGRVEAGGPVHPARGGNSQLGAGGREGSNVNTAIGAQGRPYGGGGAGGACRSTFGPALGGPGNSGVVIVENFF
jgi:hypothetical protein